MRSPVSSSDRWYNCRDARVRKWLFADLSALSCHVCKSDLNQTIDGDECLARASSERRPRFASYLSSPDPFTGSLAVLERRLTDASYERSRQVSKAPKALYPPPIYGLTVRLYPVVTNGALTQREFSAILAAWLLLMRLQMPVAAKLIARIDCDWRAWSTISGRP